MDIGLTLGLGDAALLGALVAGLVGSPHCVAMCGGLAGAASGSPRFALAYHAGRLLTYAALGAAAAAAGRALPGPPWVPLGLAAIFLTFFALRLAGWSPPWPQPLGRASHRLAALAARALRRGGPLGRLGFGAINGLLPCGLVYAALALPVATASPARGALAMLLFGAGTVPALATASSALSALARRSLATRRAMAALVFLAGVGSLVWRAPALSAPPDAPALPPCHAQP